MLGPGTALPIGPCRHGPDTSRVVPCPGTTGRAVLRAGPISPARLAIYTQDGDKMDGGSRVVFFLARLRAAKLFSRTCKSVSVFWEGFCFSLGVGFVK
jgi:hypothetical protein